ncbi:unnamed protein product [Linum tenue]|uniref:Uncharacterized protein n=1 Tax=Linum tenue TaxID=586396 RepID=A0AAV0KVV9_9ROSI|nr:unnamed protein product [Linum tenue]
MLLLGKFPRQSQIPVCKLNHCVLSAFGYGSSQLNSIAFLQQEQEGYGSANPSDLNYLGSSQGSSSVPRSRAVEEGDLGAVSAPEPVLSGPGLLPTPTDQAHDKARGKQKMVGYEGEPWTTGPNGEDPWPIGPGEEDELSFADKE